MLSRASLGLGARLLSAHSARRHSTRLMAAAHSMRTSSIRPFSAGMCTVYSTPAAPVPSVLRWAVLPWAFFIGENVVLSHNRAELMELLGDDVEGRRYHLLYNVMSTAACASLGFGYLYRVSGAPPLRPVSAVAVGGGFILQALGMAGLLQALPRIQVPFTSNADNAPGGALTGGGGGTGSSSAQWSIRCPMDFKGETTKEVTSPDGLYGLQRVSRHPMLWSLAAVGLGAAIAVPSVPQAVWLSGPAVMALIGGAHIDYRHRRHQGGHLTAEEERTTSLVPFAAMLSGAHAEGSLGSLLAMLGEVKAENAAFGVVIAAKWALRRRI